jgi:hypothetical protein
MTTLLTMAFREGIRRGMTKSQDTQAIRAKIPVRHVPKTFSGAFGLVALYEPQKPPKIRNATWCTPTWNPRRSD